MPRRKRTVPSFNLKQNRATKLFEVTYTDPATGYTRKRSTGTRDHLEAQRKMPSIVLAVMSAKPAAGAAYKLGELLEAYERSKCREGKNGTFYALKALRAFFDGFTPDQLNDAVWWSYRKQRTNQANGSAPLLGRKGKLVCDETACRELRTMAGALSWARRKGWKGLENVAVHTPNAPDYAVQEYLRRDEVEELLRACVEPHTELFVLLALATGARMSAILELTWDRVHWPTGRAPLADDTKALVWANERLHFAHEVDFDLELAPHLEPLRLDLGRGRGNKKRGTGAIPRSDSRLYLALKRAWDERKPGCDYVVSYRGKRVGKINLEPAYRRAGLLHYKRHVHLLKHTTCSLLVQAGRRFEEVAKLVGTRAETIRKHYGHLSPEHMETAGAVLSF